MQGDDPVNGSPRVEPCANIDSERTANNSSRSETISPAPDRDSHTTGPVPLFLIPKAVATEIYRHGDAIAEMDIRRTRGHNYRITVRATPPRGEDRAA